MVPSTRTRDVGRVPDPRSPSETMSAAPEDRPTGRARTLRLPRGARRRQLLEAATGVFVDTGYHAAGMDAVALAAGVSKPVLYQHFDSKHELFVSVLGLQVDRLLARLDAALASTTDNRGRVRAAITSIYEYAEHDPAGFRLVFQTEAGEDEGVRAEIDRAAHGCTDAVHDLVRGDSGLDEHRSRLLAVGLVGAARVSAGHWLDAGRPIPLEDAADTTITLCWGGLAGVPRARTA